MADLRSLLDRHLPLALQLAEHRGRPVEASLRRRLEALATCCDPAYGFLWLRCDPCAHDCMVAFSCKSRVICPRCGGRRMAGTAAHLVDEVLPEQRLRQWVITFRQPLPRLLAWKPDLLRRTLAVMTRAVGASNRRRTHAKGGRVGLV